MLGDKYDIYLKNYDSSINDLVRKGLNKRIIRSLRVALEELNLKEIPKGFEELKDLPNYIINKKGEIYKKSNRYKVTEYLSDSGYYKVYLDNKYDRFVHVLKARQYLDNPNNLRVVNHKNGKKDDNSLSNLEWVSHSDNTKHAIEKGLFKPNGMGNGRAKLSDKDVIYIFNSKEATTVLSKKYRVSKTTIKDIRAGRTWSTVTSK